MKNRAVKRSKEGIKEILSEISEHNRKMIEKGNYDNIASFEYDGIIVDNALIDPTGRKELEDPVEAYGVDNISQIINEYLDIKYN